MLSKTFYLAGAFAFGFGERLAGLFAQAPAASSGFDAAEAGKYGLIGIVLLFILYRLEPRMKGIETALNFLTQMIRLMLIEIKETSPGVRAQAVSLGEEMKAAGIKDTMQ